MRGRPRNLKPLPEDKLPPELWTEILARLPVKTLVRFRCVCKSWLSIIDDPDFISMNLTLSKNNREKGQILSIDVVDIKEGGQEWALKTFHVGTFKKSGDIIRFSYQHGRLCVIVGYVNGLMLVFKGVMYTDFVIEELLLWNPSIRKSLTLPCCPDGFRHFMMLLGFDPSSNDYKVVIFDDGQSRAAIFDLSKDCWRTKSIECDPGVSLYGNGMRVYSNGAVHWLDEISNVVVSFDCSTETLSCNDLPSEGDDRGRVCRTLFFLGESMALYDVDYGGSCIWVTGKICGRPLWTKWYSSSLFLEEVYFSIATPDCFYEEKSGVFLIRSPTTTTVGSFHVESEKWKVVRKMARKIRICFMDTYVESLVLANGLECQTMTESLASLR